MNPLRWRTMTWVLNIWNVIFLIWIIAAVAVLVVLGLIVAGVVLAGSAGGPEVTVAGRAVRSAARGGTNPGPSCYDPPGAGA